MFKMLHLKIRGAVTPLAGLALGIASLGWGLENALPLQGMGQTTGALIASFLLAILTIRFIFHLDTLILDLKHPVAGSIVPTFAMGLMVISTSLMKLNVLAGQILWLFAVIVHLFVLTVFIYHRAKDLKIHHMVPSWFVPPVGIIVADVTSPGGIFTQLSIILLVIGMVSYLIMLPLMIYRFIFCHEVPDPAKPTIAIMAAPASLCLAGYLTVIPQPSLLICALLFGIAILMTLVIYCVFFRLLRLPFSPGYAAFTFPMAIGATALYKLADLVNQYPQGQHYARQIHWLATFEIIIATIVIAYVSICYFHYYVNPLRKSTISS